MKIYISKEKHKDEHVKDKEYYKVRDYCHYTSKYNVAAHSICNLKSSIPKEILSSSRWIELWISFYYVKLWEEFKGQFIENSEKYIIFSIPIGKEFIKKGKEITKTISCRLQFIDSARFNGKLIKSC